MLAIEELGVSHQGTILIEVVHRVLEEYDLTQGKLFVSPIINL